ncbi:serine/threonine-protein kinase pakD-like [Anopheles ziemanni]|uniref:serine/threonine-protein kinase pakD-like n=1 Tax=Anopheles coustani TaxID=139045 RepID=UPI00265A2D3C|nr:serine/threonine-protein kinase pakD-like [Anopheles coustani]XP_058173385.1 serine/threonine-protein kinase pakD-like [Anopheles ziemanni]
MDNCHNYATTSKKKRIPISDDIHIIIKKFRDKDKHDEKPSTSGDHDYDDDHSMDSEELRRVRHQEPSSSSTLVGITTNSNSNSTTCASVGGTLQTVGLGNSHTVQVQLQAQQQQIISLGQQSVGVGGSLSSNSGAGLACQSSSNVGSQSEDIKQILKKLSNIEELLKIVAEQSLTRLTALKQESGNAQLQTTTIVSGQLTSVDPNPTLQQQQQQQQHQQQQQQQQQQQHQQQQHHHQQQATQAVEIESCFKFPLRSLKELIELNKSICGDESLYNKLFEHLTKIRLECDQNIVINALTSIVSDEVLDAVTWDTGKKFKLSSVVLFSDSLYVAWFKDKMKYDEYVAEMKDAIERSHKRHAKVKTKRNQQSNQLQQQTVSVMHSPLGSNAVGANTSVGAPPGAVNSISCDNSALILKVESLE